MLCMMPSHSQAQQAFSAAWNYGAILPHNKAIEPLVKDPVRGFTLNYYFPNSWGKEWRNFYNLPNFGISYNYKNYGNPGILGETHSVSSFIEMSVLPRRRYFDMGAIVYTGLGIATKKYDEVTNPANAAISTLLNITADLRVYTELRIQPFFINYSYGINHFSNALVKFPNLGINVKNHSVTLGYELEDQPVHQTVPKQERIHGARHELWGYGATGVKEVENHKGKKYVGANASVCYSYRTSPINKMGVGLDFSYDPAAEDYAYLTYDSYRGDPPLNFRTGASFHNEFLFKRTGLFTSYGFNFKMNEFYPRRAYYKVGLKMYHKNLIGAVILRAIPRFRADLLELGFGYRIPVKRKKAGHEN